MVRPSEFTDPEVLFIAVHPQTSNLRESLYRTLEQDAPHVHLSANA